MARASVEQLREVRVGTPGDWCLCFQWVRYKYDDAAPPQMGYRFIWRRPNGSLQAAMGQARIPCASDMYKLIEKATEAGWFIKVEAERDDYDECQTV